MDLHSTPGRQEAGSTEPAPPAPPKHMVDTHFHVFDPRHAGKMIRPRESASLAEYLAFRRELGISRSVIIAPSSYGKNNDCLLESLQELGSEDNRGVIIPDGELTASRLDDYHRRGIRGLRLYAGHGDLEDHAALKRLAATMAALGWHLQLLGDAGSEPFVELEPVLSALPCTIVLDHFAFAPQPDAARSRTAATIHRLLETGRTYVKLSGMYIQSLAGPPHYSDFDELAADLINRAPDRLLWGSDWPHTMAKIKPSGRDLLGRLAAWTSDESVRNDILRTNPMRLYWG